MQPPIKPGDSELSLRQPENLLFELQSRPCIRSCVCPLQPRLQIVCAAARAAIIQFNWVATIAAIIATSLATDTATTITAHLACYISPYLLCPKPPLYTLSLYRGLQSLGLLGCPTLYAVYPFLNREQSCTTPVLPLCASDLIGWKSSSRSRSAGRAILLAQIGCTRAGVPKRYVNTTQNTKI